LLLTDSERMVSGAMNLAARELDGLGEIEFLTCGLEPDPVAFACEADHR